MSNNVVVAGGANIDIVAAPNAPLKEHDSNPGHSSISFGGVGRNIAENLSRLGCNVRFVSVFGDDSFSKALTDDLVNKGIDTSLCKTIRGQTCSKYICINSEKGELIAAINDMSLYDHMYTAITDETIEAMNEADMVVLDANTSKELLEKIAAHCNTPIAFDAVSISKVERCRNILDRLFIFKPNLYEAEALCKSLVPPDQDEDRVIRAFDSPDILYKASEYAGYLINKGVKNVMISLGEDGVYYANASTIGVIPTMVTDIVNTSGCGDTFLSGAIRGFLDNADIETMARYGSAAAAICASCEETVSEKLSYRKITEMLGR
ncbi:MAG: carbohydrate kinase family protein [Lachnospiraceae bacterium]|nr:carbohydrate kinase family protein [Lachnospiraceae bacterium]